MRAFLLVLPLLAFAGGCGTEEPQEAPTSADFPLATLSLRAELRSNGGLVQVFVFVSHESSTIALGSDDELLFGEQGGPQQQLVPFQGQYIGQIATGSVDFTLALARKQERFEGTLSLPPAFTLSGPAAPASRAMPIPVEWDPKFSDAAQLEIFGDCLTYSLARNFEKDPGAYSIQPADLPSLPGSCDLLVEVQHAGSATDFVPGLPSSGAATTQIRTITVPTIP
jgi:hypothetical protein